MPSISNNFTVETSGDELKITHFQDELPHGRRTSLSEVFLSVITHTLTVSGCLVAVGLVVRGIIASYIWPLNSLDNMLFLVNIVLLALVIGGCAGYLMAANKYMVTLIVIDPHHLIVKYGPIIPWPWRKQFELSSLKQLYSEIKLKQIGHEYSSLWLVTNQLNHHEVLDKLSHKECRDLAALMTRFLSRQGVQLTPYARSHSSVIKGITTDLSANSLTIVSQWRHTKAIQYGVISSLFSIFMGWLFFTIVSSFLEQRIDALTGLLILAFTVLIFGGGAILLMVLTYCYSVRFFNKSSIRIDSTSFQIQHGPLPYRRNKTFKSADITQLYSEKVSVEWFGDNELYDLYLTTQDGKHHKLFAVAYPDQVRYLEQTIEDYLGLDPRLVSGEFGLGSFANQKLAFVAWQKLAEKHCLEFSKIIDWASLSGTYQGHQLTLETGRDKNGAIHTYLKVTAVPPETVTDFFLSSQHLEQLFPPNMAKARLGRPLQVGAKGNALIYHQESIITELEYLQFLFDKLCELLNAFPSIIVTGGQAMPTLLAVAEQRAHPLQPVSTHLLSAIAQETTKRLSQNASQLICPDCLTQCAAHSIQQKSLSIPAYYGCRTCGQSREFLEVIGQVIAVLDHQMSVETASQGANLQVNWLARQSLFDFDTIEIKQASDEQVERFAVQVGNDTNSVRQPRYSKMRCVVSPECGLSENTMRILGQTFNIYYERNNDTF